MALLGGRLVAAAFLFILMPAAIWAEGNGPGGGKVKSMALISQPQLTTSSRLIRLGESIAFEFHVPEGAETGPLVIHERYLEQAEPGSAFSPKGDLAWVEGLASKTHEVKPVDGRASVTLKPESPGNHLARWLAGGELFYRYFSVVEDDWVILAFSTFVELESEPTLHATGIPVCYRLPAERYGPEDPLFQKFLGYHRHYGDCVTPVFPDTPSLYAEERLALYRKGIEGVRALLPDPSDGRTIRVEMHHDLDPGYTQTFMQLGVNDHCGLWEANAKPWLGMPEFPYFSSPEDCRKVRQTEGGTVFAHQWDFCSGWHFLGPVSWHYKVAEGQWERAERCLRRGMEELRNAAELSQHPVFAFPLYDGVLPAPGYPNELFVKGFGGEPMLRFVERYQRLLAFDFPKQHKVAYARTIDMADYYRRHFKTTPRTVFVSKTDHVQYDMWWLSMWCDGKVLVPRERIPWLTRVSSILSARRQGPYWKDPLSYEYVLIEDQRRSIRFERECPNPIWWFDYTKPDLRPEGSAIAHTETPDVTVIRSPWIRNKGRMTTTLTMKTNAEFPDYVIVLWGLPDDYKPGMQVDTDAKDYVVARSTEGECHLVLFFDLKPDAQLEVAFNP